MPGRAWRAAESICVYFAVGDQQSVRLLYSDAHGANWNIGATAT